MRQEWAHAWAQRHLPLTTTIDLPAGEPANANAQA